MTEALATAGQVEADPLNPQIPEPVLPGTESGPQPAGQNAPGPTGEVEPIWVDYFGFDETHEFTFPDHRSKIYYKAMNEGDRAKYQRETNRDVQLERNTGNARIKTDPAGERRALIVSCVTGWNLKRNVNGVMQDVPFSKGSKGANLEQFLDRANPKLVDALEEAIRKANPWLVGEMSLEDIDQEIERLQDLREEKIKLEAEKEAFRS
jgi:hypothetical protein